MQPYILRNIRLIYCGPLGDEPKLAWYRGVGRPFSVHSLPSGQRYDRDMVVKDCSSRHLRSQFASWGNEPKCHLLVALYGWGVVYFNNNYFFIFT